MKKLHFVICFLFLFCNNSVPNYPTKVANVNVVHGRMFKCQPFLFLFLLCHDNVKENHGPCKTALRHSAFHSCNVNSINGYNLIKGTLKAFHDFKSKKKKCMK